MPSLFLKPENVDWYPEDAGSFAATLAGLGLLELHPVSSEDSAYQAGERFLQLISFLGCSPRIAMRSEDARNGEEVCGVRLRDFARITFLGSEPLPQPRCRNCRAPLQLRMPEESGAEILCGQCNQLLPAHAIDWRRGAGCGRFFIEISGIYPHEAVPAEQLLQKLAAHSACEWTYFYINKQSCTP